MFLLRRPNLPLRNPIQFSKFRNSYSTRRLTVTDVLKQTQKLRVGNDELKALKEGSFEEIPAKKGAKIKDVERIFKKTPKPTKSKDTSKHKKVRGPRKQKARSTKEKESSSTISDEQLIKVSRNVDPKEIPFSQAKKLKAAEIPTLAHKLDRVLFSPGVQFLQDPRTRIYNFDPHLSEIMHIDEFDFLKIEGFVTVSKDETLLKEAIANNKRFYSSTLSMTLTLHQLYLFLNNYHELSKSRFEFPQFSRTCTTLPLSVIIEPKGQDPEGKTIYSVSSDKSADVEILLGAMGHCLEAMLTHTKEEFQKFMKVEPGETKGKETAGETKGRKADETCEEADVEKQPEVASSDVPLSPSSSSSPQGNVYNYLTCGEFLMRSQLDCYDPRLPGNGTFDLKTRAVCAIRHDRNSDASKSTYQIWKLKGQYESFEREYNDLIRTGALLKYGFQARIGQMDGIFVAYHNVKLFFGFQYLPLLDIDQVFYGDKHVQKSLENNLEMQPETQDQLATEVAESQFKVSLSIWQDLMNTVISDMENTPYANSAFRLVLKRNQNFVPNPRHPTRKMSLSSLQVYAVPLSGETIKKFQLFLDQFETSFRAQISAEERTDNLREYQSELDRFNKELAEKSPVLKYTVKCEVAEDGEVILGPGRHPYPKLTQVRTAYKYTIKAHPGNETAISSLKIDGDSAQKDQYLSLMKLLSQTLTLSVRTAEKTGSASPSLVDQMRRYSAVGQRRRETWHLKQNPPVLFKHQRRA